MLKDMYNHTATHGGLLARTFLVTEQGEFRPSNALLKENDKTSSYNNLKDKLQTISTLKGKVHFTQEAINIYEPWYNDFRMSYRGRDKGGVAGRMHTGVLKLAMILAANENELEIRGKHIQEAIHECIILMPNYNSFIMSAGKSNISEAGAILLLDLQKAKATDYCLDKREILRNHWQDFDIETLDKLVATLEEGGMIKSIIAHPTIYYQLTPRALEILGKGKEQKA
jgi:hypothetical protein